MVEEAPQNPTLKTLLALAWPIALARATQSVIGFTDALFVAPLGEAALAATTMGALNTFAAMILPTGTVFIVQSFAAQLRGRGQLEAVPRYAWYGLAIAVLSGVLALTVIPIVPSLVGRLGYAADVRDLMVTYVSIRLLSVAPAVATEALGNWFGGLGNTRPALVGGVTAMLLNVVGAWVFIEGRWGFPAYGVRGAAWASVFASWMGFLVVLGLFLKSERKERLAALAQLRFAELRRVLRFGLPNGVNWFLEFAAFVLFLNVVVGHLGTTVLAALNVVMQINSISFMPAFGVASSGAILVGEAIGKRSLSSVWPIVKLTMGVTITWMMSVGLLYFVFPDALIGLFRPRDVPAEALMAVGATMLATSCIWQLFDAMSMTLSEALRAAGDTAWCMWARIVLAWLVFTPISWVAVLVYGGGVNTVLIAMVAYLCGLAALFAWRFSTGRWRNIDMVGEPQVI